MTLELYWLGEDLSHLHEERIRLHVVQKAWNPDTLPDLQFLKRGNRLVDFAIVQRLSNQFVVTLRGFEGFDQLDLGVTERLIMPY